ncbi:hypothetical protein GCM10010471_13900 [Leucobacter komagatae]
MRDIGYVLPGFFVSLFAFSLLVPLASLGIATLIIWLGALLLPATLLLATKFAHLSRSRAAWWGESVPPPGYQVVGEGVTGFMRIMADGRRWLDLAFETLVAFPARAITFSIGITWLSAALGGHDLVHLGPVPSRKRQRLPRQHASRPVRRCTDPRGRLLARR